MKKFFIVLTVVVLLGSILCIADDLRFYDQLNVFSLPAGATIYLTIKCDDGFTVGGSSETITSYSSNIVIPRSIQMGSYNVQVSSANVYCIRHGEYLLK